jgi:hypothetical protein
MLDRSSRAEVLIELGPGGGDEELDRSTEQLRRRLRELDVEDVRRPATESQAEAATGASAAPPEIAAGEESVLVVQLAPVLPALHDVVHTVRAWLSHNPGRVATLAIDGDRIEVTGNASDEQRELVRSWTDRHSPSEL